MVWVNKRRVPLPSWSIEMPCGAQQQQVLRIVVAPGVVVVGFGGKFKGLFALRQREKGGLEAYRHFFVQLLVAQVGGRVQIGVASVLSDFPQKIRQRYGRHGLGIGGQGIAGHDRQIGCGDDAQLFVPVVGPNGKEPDTVFGFQIGVRDIVPPARHFPGAVGVAAHIVPRHGLAGIGGVHAALSLAGLVHRLYYVLDPFRGSGICFNKFLKV